ncbi:MAG TPA: FAD-dependent oxidoreductase [Terriglobales bacterium]|nr:FAD-dependent oxidoreductase [Terriglobales bacterium]
MRSPRCIYDLIVTGGGPAGCSAAITAARAGCRVLLLERGRYPRQKVCGEFVSAESLGLLGSLLNGTSQLVDEVIRIDAARIFVDRSVLRSTVDPSGASITRLDLDAALWESAQQSGVDARQQTTVQVIEGDGPFVVRCTAGEFESRAVIDCSGRWSNLNASPEHPGAQRAKWIGMKAHCEEPEAAQSVDLYFFDGGYCGVQPVTRAEGKKASRINVCAMVRADVATDMQGVFSQSQALTERSNSWQKITEPVTTSPLVFRAPRPVREHVLAAGDAAGFVDPFVGDGISLALRSGTLAGQSLLPFINGIVQLPRAVEAYRKAYERTLAPVFRISSQLRRLLLLPKPARSLTLAVLRNTPSLLRYAVRKTR